MHDDDIFILFGRPVDIFMDDFSVFGNSYAECLNNLDEVLSRCKETNLTLNKKKCHFMVTEGIVLGYKISNARSEVDLERLMWWVSCHHL